MPLNLITDAWLPVRRASGARHAVSPAGLTADGDPVVALDFPRPDWNAAVTEWLIGVLFLALRPAGHRAWARRFGAPPTPADLAAALAPLAPYFDLGGGPGGDGATGPAAFQDWDALAGAEARPLSGLLIDAPGENTVKNNADLFIKRREDLALCLPYAAAALITLQTYAPSGGAGHRTSLRGGGPLTTLLAPSRKRADGTEVATLWDLLWANVPDAGYDPIDVAAAPERVFPWLSPTRVSKNDQATTPDDTSPAMAFFACPRRIRLVFGAAEGACGLGGGRGPLVTGYRTLNYGASYASGWQHPLSPYREDKKAGLLPLHPQAGASDYGDWLAWWGLRGAPARVVALWQDRRDEIEDQLGHEGVRALGFDMDNMKARQWLEMRLPWVPVQGDEGKALSAALLAAAEAAEATAQAVRFAAKLALYGQRQGHGYRLPETLPLDALPEPAERLWRETEGAFRALVTALRLRHRESLAADHDLREGWTSTLRAAAWRIFDETVDLDGLTDQSPHRLLYARDDLGKRLLKAGGMGIRKARA
ncbi:type I-E CRISPR-associated protein Cse1/CasA [Nitrospirillum sp. BR 11828]|uniref:type I-E CRISPR-associated protein Cse1/CasA n=1 Tax=Nitrospirillum sp. BR 11828 TaxID=3104325 RepID=UPI002ACAC7FD|nr:type I-E CRISPR-associated protein Cse1/CasA [Nitrospirillum sp. BR 11828]MDZ5649991.1 type I-E CRISPR-associated protein Cse1/CasA [Nitrospirillum sp. BR 11828]